MLDVTERCGVQQCIMIVVFQVGYWRQTAAAGGADCHGDRLSGTKDNPLHFHFQHILPVVRDSAPATIWYPLW